MTRMPWRTRRRACPTCGALAENGIFCRMCGSRLEDAGAAAAEGMPPVLRSARSLLPGLAVAAAVVVIVLIFILVSWVAGVLAVIAAALIAAIVLLFQRWAEEPRSPVTEVRDRARFAVAFVQVRSSVRRQVAAIDGELHGLQARRQKGLLALGEASYGDDDDAITRARDDVRALDEEIEQQHETRRRVVEEANAYIERERGFVEPTEVVAPNRNPEEAPDVEHHRVEPDVEHQRAEPAQKGTV
jgi:hypothetical protein